MLHLFIFSLQSKLCLILQTNFLEIVYIFENSMQFEGSLSLKGYKFERTMCQVHYGESRYCGWRAAR